MSTERERCNDAIACGDLPLQHGASGCGARNWRVFSNALLNKAAGERLLTCQDCGADCLIQFAEGREPVAEHITTEGARDGR